MGWADKYIEDLLGGKCVSFRPRGNSMTPLIKSGDLIHVHPDVNDLKIDDIVLCKVRGNQYLHLVKAVTKDKVLIGNNHGKINGWTPRNCIYGKKIS